MNITIALLHKTSFLCSNAIVFCIYYRIFYTVATRKSCFHVATLSIILEQRRRIVIQLRKDLLHDGFAEEYGLGIDTELLTIAVNGSHLAVIQINHLPVTTHKGLLLLLQVLGIDTRMHIFLFSSQFRQLFFVAKVVINS